MNVLRVTVKRFRSKIASLEEELDKTKDLLERAERKLDKIQINASLERSGNENFQKEQKLNEKSIVSLNAAYLNFVFVTYSAI